jgi:hypothetical protein
MKEEPMGRHLLWTKARILAGLIVVTGVLLLALANTHLVYVAVTSQPDCVPHAKSVSERSGSFRAAAPAC